MFAERASTLPSSFSDFQICPAANNRSAWTALNARTKSRIRSAGEKALNTDWPDLSPLLYAQYARTGNRVQFEKSYFARRRMLNAMVLAECVEYNGFFLNSIIDAVRALCTEPGWQLPAHNASVRGGPRLENVDTTNPIIDIFAAETGALLATLLAVLGDEIDAHDDNIIARVDHEIDKRILTPYRTKYFWWMGNRQEKVNNWTPWCTQNILLTAIVRTHVSKHKNTHAKDIIQIAAASLDHFLDTYGQDGACEEGALYYRHAGLCLFGALNVLASIAPAAFEPLWSEPKIKNIAEFILGAYAGGGWYFNFADSPPRTEPCGAREYLFGQAVGSSDLANFAASDWNKTGQSILPEEINLSYRLQSIFSEKSMRQQASPPPAKRDKFFSSIGLFVAHDDTYALAVKAGNNGESHNHNDAGSVIIYKNNRPFLIDVGVETYTSKTFSTDRYDIWTMQSAYHNLLTFDNVMQNDGAEYVASVLEIQNSDKENSIILQLADAYPKAAQLRSYTRRVHLHKNQKIVLEDRFDTNLPACLTLMFAVQPIVSAGEIQLKDLGKISVVGAGVMRIEQIPISDARLRKVWPDTLYRVLIPATSDSLELTIV